MRRAGERDQEQRGDTLDAFGSSVQSSVFIPSGIGHSSQRREGGGLIYKTPENSCSWAALR